MTLQTKNKDKINLPIRIEKLNFSYSPKSPFRKDALIDITAKINDGDYFGIIGHTGSGKSTLVQHLNGLIRIQKDSGTVFVDDMDLTVKKFDYKRLRSKVGMVFQYPEYQLFDETVEKDVGFGPRNLGLPAEEIEVRVRESIIAVGLDYDEVRKRSPFELSGGQKRRVAIAGVIAMRPNVLILDEPTAGLDPRGRREILELIKKIKAEFCPTIIMISHNMDEIAANCDRIAVLNQGRLMYVLPPDELFKKSAEITAVGLDIPIVTKIGDSLGFSGVHKTDDLIDRIVQKFGGKI